MMDQTCKSFSFDFGFEPRTKPQCFFSQNMQDFLVPNLIKKEINMIGPFM